MPLALKNENLPAFPTEISYNNEDFTGMPIINKKHCYGITKREYFLSQVVCGFIAKHGVVDFTSKDIKRINEAVYLIMNLE